MRFEFATATRILFGPGTVTEVSSAAATLGRRALLVTGSNAERSAPLRRRLTEHDIAIVAMAVAGEPTVETVRTGVQCAREEACELIIGMGGGSAVDAGKAIAALLTNPGDPLDYLEVIGRGRALINLSAPYIAIPTTAGTGAEVTRNAVLASHEHHVKVSLRSPLMFPRLAVIDPELTYALPPAITASTGLDALTQLIEPFVSNSANPLTDALCREGMRRAARSLRRAYENGSDAAAREDMAVASLFGGLALANAKLGVVHGCAAPLGGLFPAPHGAVCARLLPHVMDANVRALQAHSAGSPPRYAEIARILTGRAEATISEGIEWVRTLCDDLKIPGLSQYGLTEAAIPSVVAEAQRASSTKGNPVALNDRELSTVLRQAL